jgi:hypothetical protein
VAGAGEGATIVRSWISRSLRLAGCALALLGWPATLAHVQAQSTPVAEAGVEQYTPVVQSVLSTPRWFTGSDNQVHLTYELWLINAFPVETTVTMVEVLDAGTGASISSLSGDALTAAMSFLSVPTTPTSTLPRPAAWSGWMCHSKVPKNYRQQLSTG